MTTPDITPRSTRRVRAARSAVLALALALVASACGPFGRSEIEVAVSERPAASEHAVDPAGDTGAAGDPGAAASDEGLAATAPVRYEEAGEPGTAPFSPVALLSITAPDTEARAVAGAPADDVAADTVVPGAGPGLYGGSGTNVCDEAALRTFLTTSPTEAAAWAAALAIEVDQIDTYLDDLVAVTLPSATRVTNHGFVDGRARPFQSVLGPGTAVLIDAAGTPRVRCACGNPLDVPVDTPEPKPEPTPNPQPTPERQEKPDSPDVEVTPTPTPVPLLDFCATWAEFGPTIAGGPAGDIPGYLLQSILVFEALIEAAEREPAFPDWAMDDLTAFVEDLRYASDTGDLTAGDVALRTRIEGFLTRYCEDGARPNG